MGDSAEAKHYRQELSDILMHATFPHRFLNALDATDVEKLGSFSLSYNQEFLLLYKEMGPLHNAANNLDDVFEPERPLVGRKLCLTRRGFTGSVPLGARVGDKVYILAGVRLPVILRQDELLPSSPFTRFVGCSFIHGLMDGEALFLDGFERQALMIR